MRNAIGRAAAAAILSGLLGAVSAALVYAWHPSLRIEFDRDLPRNVSGIYPPERDEASGLTFAWTGQDAVVRLPGLDRRASWTLDLRVRGARQGQPNPDLTILADGVVLSAVETFADWRDVRIVIPPRPERRGLTVGLRSSGTLTPGASDPRALGVMVDRLSLGPDGVILVPRPALDASAVASGAIGAALALLGLTAGSAIGGSVLLSAATAAVVSRGFGPFTDYPETVIRLGLWIGLVVAALALTIQWRRGKPLRNTARFAAAFSASAVFLKLLVLLHPDMPIGDAMFHAHRFQGVLAGHLYFTSIAPGGYTFPYPPGLYVFASAFAGLVRRGAGDAALLRIVTCAVDGLAGLLLYRIVASGWRHRLAGAMAVAVYHLIPVDFAVLTTGNLTNAFAQSVAVGGLALMSAESVRIRGRAATTVLAAVLAIAYLSHTGTFAILFVATLATAALFFVRGGPDLRSGAAAVALATLAAATLAVAVYYAHFMDTYRAELARIGREAAANAPDAGGRTIAERLRSVPYYLGITIGAPVLLCALAGTIACIRRGANRLALAAAGWGASCLAFLVLGILTPIDMRHYLAAVPVLAVTAGYGAAVIWSDVPLRHRTLARAGAAVLLGWTAWTGFDNWWSTLG